MHSLTKDNRKLKNHDEVHDVDVCSLGKDWNENVSFGGGKRKLKMQSVGRSTTTTLNVKHKCKTVMFARNKVFCSGFF